MKILVPVSKVPDTTSKIEFTDGNTRFKTDGVQFIMNPTDEWYALVRAVELKEQHGGSVTLINVGGAENDQIIRKGLAIGADDAIRVDTDPTDAFQVAKLIADQAKEGSYDLVITGKETIDYNGFQVGAMLAELLDMPYVGLVTKLDVADGTAKLSREIEGGEEEVSVSLPMVVGSTKGLAEQRIPNMRGIMQARSKPLQVVPGSGDAARTKIANYEEPAAKTGVKLVDPDNVEELVRLLHEEAKVI